MELRRMLVFFGVCALLFSSGIYMAVSASDEYHISVSPAVEIPEQTEEVEGIQVTIDSIGTIDADAPISVSVTVPGDTDWTVELRNADNQIVDMEHGSASDDLSFAGVEPGSYVVVLDAGGIQDVSPFISNAYDISTDVPTEIAHDESVTVSASFDTIEDVGYAEVEAVLWNGQETRQSMEPSNGEYVTTFADLDPGTYTVSVNMRNDQEVEHDESEVIAMGDPVSFTVESEPDDDDGGDDSAPGTGPGGADDSDDADPGETDDGDDADPGETDDGDDTDPGETDDGDDADPGEVDDGDDADPGEVDDGDDADPGEVDDGDDADPGEVDDGDDADPGETDDTDDADGGDDLLMPGDGDLDDDTGDDPDDTIPLHAVPMIAVGLLAFGIMKRVARMIQ